MTNHALSNNKINKISEIDHRMVKRWYKDRRTTFRNGGFSFNYDSFLTNK